MALVAVEPDGTLIFMSSRATETADEVTDDPHVLVTFQRNKDCYLSLTGEAAVRKDPAEIARLWKEPFEIWFPKGKDDPSLFLIAVHPVEGEYWDNRGMRRFSCALDAARAYAAARQPAMRPGEQHGGPKWH